MIRRMRKIMLLFLFIMSVGIANAQRPDEPQNP